MIAYLGLGSNVGDRLANLRAAAARIGAQDGISVLARSSVYETEPMGAVTDQPDFLNAALRIESALDPLDLLRACKRVERELGRVPGGPRHGPRPIDVDLLLAGDLQLETDSLILPHPETADRRFVLVPLLELEPALCLPGGGSVQSALDGLRGQRVEWVGDL